MTSSVRFADAAMPFPDVSDTAPASIPICGAARAAADMSWEDVRLTATVVPLDAVTSAAPVSAVRFAPPASCTDMPSSITEPTSIASLNDRVRTPVSSSRTAPSSAGGVVSVTVR